VDGVEPDDGEERPRLRDSEQRRKESLEGVDLE
jgi:hypothetical protein